MCAEALAGRRAVLSASLAGAGWGAMAALWPSSSSGRARSPVGGRAAFHLPWSIAQLDPHRIDDPLAALLGAGLFDTLYAWDSAGEAGEAGGATPSGQAGPRLVPALAEGEPEPIEDRGAPALRVPVRGGLRTAAGRPLDARDVLASLARARARGARAWLAPLGDPRLDGRGALVFPARDPVAAMATLASPLTAIVPIGFQPERPDGTGPLRFERRGDREGDAVVLTRNGNAARGPALLDEVVVRFAADLAVSLRAFESGEDDVGWLGSGLHEPRAGAQPFDAGPVAWAVLRTGGLAGPGHLAGSTGSTGSTGSAWNAPGLAQRLADGLPPARLAYLGLGPPWTAEAAQAWGGPPGDVLVRDDGPWLVEVARAVAATMGQPGHELSVRAVAPTEFVRRRAARDYLLAIDVVRPLSPTALGALVGLATADDAGAEEVARHPPRLAEGSPRRLTRQLRLGVVGEIRVQGSRVVGLSLPPSPAWGGVDLGAAARGREP